MFCPKCSQPVQEGARFCTHCGAAVADPATAAVIPAPPGLAGEASNILPVAQGSRRAEFQWKWVAIAIPVILVLQFLLGLLAAALTGGSAISIVISSVVSFFAGGLLVAYWSPGITIREPAVGIAVAVVAANLILLKSSASIGAAMIGWVLPFFLGLMGARLGELLQARKRAALASESMARH